LTFATRLAASFVPADFSSRASPREVNRFGAFDPRAFSGNNARLYNIDPKKAMLDVKGDRFAMMRAEYDETGPEPSTPATAM
jgi:hypothetical protein